MSDLFHEFEWRGQLANATEGASDALARQNISAYVEKTATTLDAQVKRAATAASQQTTASQQPKKIIVDDDTPPELPGQSRWFKNPRLKVTAGGDGPEGPARV